MDNLAQNREKDAFISRLKGAINRFEDKGLSTDIGFLDELSYNICEQYFSQSRFCEYFYFSPHSDSSRKFLSIGEEADLSEFVYVHAVPDKFHNPTHQDYMGALMSLQIDRKIFGDLFVTENCDAFFVVWNQGEVLTHIYENFLSCGKAKLKLEAVSSERYSCLQMKYEHKELIVSSLRADCIVSAVINNSRARAKSVILSGDFKVFSNPMTYVDRNISVGEVFSVRGYGKYRFDGVVGTTHRDRMRISLSKFGNYIERNRCNDSTS